MDDNTLLSGGIVQNVYNSLPAYKRNFLRTFIKPRNMGNSDFTNDELNALRQAVYNKQYELNYGDDLSINNRIADVNKRREEMNNSRSLFERLTNTGKVPMLDANKYNRQAISYENYKPTYVPNDYGQEKSIYPFEASLTDLQKLENLGGSNDFSMAGTIGSAPYKIDDKGNVTLSDRYDFANLKMGNPIATFAHLIAHKLGTPYNINLDLGNINDWNMKYTGNQLLGIGEE